MKKCFLLLGVLVLSSCLTVGKQFSSHISFIQKGETMRSEIDAKLGAPFRMGYDNGLFAYTYVYYKYNIFSETMTKDLVVRFRADGKVESYSFTTSFPDEKKAIDPEYKESSK